MEKVEDKKLLPAHQVLMAKLAAIIFRVAINLNYLV